MCAGGWFPFDAKSVLARWYLVASEIEQFNRGARRWTILHRAGDYKTSSAVIRGQNNGDC
jgi:hypothetical protein